MRGRTDAEEEFSKRAEIGGCVFQTVCGVGNQEPPGTIESRPAQRSSRGNGKKNDREAGGREREESKSNTTPQPAIADLGLRDGRERSEKWKKNQGPAEKKEGDGEE